MFRFAPSEAPVDEPVEEALPEQEEVISEPEVLGEESMGSGIVDPAVARYLGPESRCEGCIHFAAPGSCEIVAGPVDPQGVCSLFTPDAGMEMPIEDVPMDESMEPVEPIT